MDYHTHGSRQMQVTSKNYLPLMVKVEPGTFMMVTCDEAEEA